jgi:nitrite reductase/ring-hydroxylating ferredoxin subunit
MGGLSKMWKKIGIVLLMVALIAVVAGCATQQRVEQPAPSTNTEAGPAPSQATTTPPEDQPAPVSASKPAGPIKAIWIEPQVDGDIYSIPLSDINQNWNVHFKVEPMNFMAYTLDGEIYVRANVCPPCRSTGFSLNDDILVCDRCATKFEAKTGDGIEGACVDYPKASISYDISDGYVLLKKQDLAAAYEETLQPG